MVFIFAPAGTRNLHSPYRGSRLHHRRGACAWGLNSVYLEGRSVAETALTLNAECEPGSLCFWEPEVKIISQRGPVILLTAPSDIFIIWRIDHLANGATQSDRSTFPTRSDGENHWTR